MDDFGKDVLPRVEQYLPIMVQEYRMNWNSPSLSELAYFAGQIEQETCPTLDSSKCWNPYAELKTSREYGFGLGQLTVTPKYDNFKAATQLSPSLKNWSYSDRYNAEYQIRTIVFMNKGSYARLDSRIIGDDRFAMMFAAYNGGIGGVLSDIKVCKATLGCDPTKWFDNVEKTSLKAKTKVTGYGKSFFDINREYPRNIMFLRNRHYQKLVK
jgi:hypothetical protein